MNGNAWTARETNALVDFLFDAPWPIAARRYTLWASERGFPFRTEKAMQARVCRAVGAIEAHGEWLTPWTIQTILECPSSRPYRWLKAFPDTLAARRPFGPGGKAFIHRASLRRLARRHPEQFAGCRRSNLFILLEDADLADSIPAAYPDPMPRSLKLRRPVLNITTGETFPSVSAAAAAVGLHRTAITRAIRRRWNAAGSRWAHLHQQEAAA